MTQSPTNTFGLRPGASRLARGLAELMEANEHRPSSAGEAFLRRGFEAAFGHKPRQPPPDGLKTAAQAAAKLGISIKTLNGHVATGALKYVALGHGKKRQRKMFADTDLNEFIANQTRKEPPCLSDATRGRRSGNTTSRSTVVAFSALRRRPPGGKPKP